MLSIDMAYPTEMMAVVLAIYVEQLKGADEDLGRGASAPLSFFCSAYHHAPAVRQMRRGVARRPCGTCSGDALSAPRDDAGAAAAVLYVSSVLNLHIAERYRDIIWSADISEEEDYNPGEYELDFRPPRVADGGDGDCVEPPAGGAEDDGGAAPGPEEATAAPATSCAACAYAEASPHVDAGAAREAAAALRLLRPRAPGAVADAAARRRHEKGREAGRCQDIGRSADIRGGGLRPGWMTGWTPPRATDGGDGDCAELPAGGAEDDDGAAPGPEGATAAPATSWAAFATRRLLRTSTRGRRGRRPQRCGSSGRGCRARSPTRRFGVAMRRGGEASQRVRGGEGCIGAQRTFALAQVEAWREDAGSGYGRW